MRSKSLIFRYSPLFSYFQTNSTAQPPRPWNWLAVSIFTTLFCCLPCGVLAIVSSRKVRNNLKLFCSLHQVVMGLGKYYSGRDIAPGSLNLGLAVVLENKLAYK